MARRRKRGRQKASNSEPDAAESGPAGPEQSVPPNNPFAALEGLKASLPARRDVPPAPEPEANEPDEELEPEPEQDEDEAEAQFVREMQATGVSELPEAVARAKRRCSAEGPHHAPPSKPESSPEPLEEGAEPELEPGLADTLRRVRAVDRARRSTPEAGAAAGGRPRESPLIDLHGLGIDDAPQELARFVRLHVKAGTRQLRVITGIGRHSGDGRSGLREAVTAWLDGSSSVTRWRSAPAHEGGAGLLLVDLRRKPRD